MPSPASARRDGIARERHERVAVIAFDRPERRNALDIPIRRGLYLMKHIGAISFEQSMAFTESQIALFALTEDAVEGQAAFRQKRAPKWSGR